MVQIVFMSVKGGLLCFWPMWGTDQQTGIAKKPNRNKRKLARTILKYPAFKKRSSI